MGCVCRNAPACVCDAVTLLRERPLGEGKRRLFLLHTRGRKPSSMTDNTPTTTYTHTPTHTQPSTHTHIYTFIHIHTQTYTHTHTHHNIYNTPTQPSTHTYIHANVHTYTHHNFHTQFMWPTPSVHPAQSPHPCSQKRSGRPAPLLSALTDSAASSPRALRYSPPSFPACPSPLQPGHQRSVCQSVKQAGSSESP